MINHLVKAYGTVLGPPTKTFNNAFQPITTEPCSAQLLSLPRPSACHWSFAATVGLRSRCG